MFRRPRCPGPLLAVLVAGAIGCARPPAPRRPAPPPTLAFELQPETETETETETQTETETGTETEPPAAPSADQPAVAPAPAAASGQVALWADGRQVGFMPEERAVDEGYILLDVGRSWVPALLRSTPRHPHDYESRYVDLANERFADTPEGRRARRDRYLELYGIIPSPAVLAARWAELRAYTCAREPVPPALRAFGGVEWDEHGDAPATPVDPDVVRALRYRLRCAGHLRVDGDDELDHAVRRALEEFERRHRIYARGELRGETLAALKAPLLELERQALLRVLSERLMLDLGLIADGSAPEPADGGRGVGNVEAAVRSYVQRSLGIDTVAGARRLHGRLASVMQRDHYLLALPPRAMPSYHDDDMELSVEIDRGDVYYDFPYDEEGRPVEQPVERRPTLTLYTQIDGGRVPLVRYGTTIGGWRIQRHRGRDYFEYKESPVGLRVWARVDSAPVWFPPPGMPPEALVLETRRTHTGELVRELNENLVGPGYASAFGLVAAYHRRLEHASGSEGVDEGIRTHASSDYTSIWRRASLGCHRLHNHRALRLFSFILAHRPHRRTGHRSVHFHMPVTLGDFSATFDVHRGGYGFELQRPLPVEVLRGRILGRARRAPARRIPADRILGDRGPS